MSNSDYEVLELTYELTDKDICTIDSCCLSRSDEQGDSIKDGLLKLKVKAIYDPDWGFLKLISVNGIPLEY